MPRRLRARLALSHALVAAATIALVLGLTVLLIRRYETRVEIQRLTSIARPLALRSNIDRLAGGVDQSSSLAPLRINRLDEQAVALDVRLIVLDGSGGILHDTDTTSSLDETALRRIAAVRATVTSSAVVAERRQIALGPRAARTPFPGQVVIASLVRGSDSGEVLILVSARDRFPLLRPALVPLAVIAAVALLVAVGTGLTLSRRIARPVERLTGAIDAMASGGLDQRVEGDGPDELGQLMVSFNMMSQRVAMASRSQRDLLANVAHELRTPLTSIRGFSRAMVDGVIRTDDDRVRALETIDREAERMSSLIGELLDLARLQGGAVTLARSPVSVRSLLSEVAERFTVAAGVGGVALSAESPDDLAVSGERGRLVQLFSNLVANALAHTPNGGSVRLVGRSHGDERGRRTAVVTVTDTGAGISPDRLEQIFDRFITGDPPKGAGGGLGLGLSIVREIVALHGGTILVESTVGVGTTFTVRLPPEDEPTVTPRA